MKKLITICCLLLTVATLTLSTFAGVAQAATASATLTIAPGTRQCVGQIYAAYQVRATGSVISVPGQSTAPVKFTVAGNNVQVYDATTTSFIFAAASQFSPALFPKSYQTCARNQSTKPVTVQLSLQTDADVR